MTAEKGKGSEKGSITPKPEAKSTDVIKPEKGDVLKFTKGEALPVIDVDAPMPQVTPAQAKPSEPAQASPAPDTSQGSGTAEKADSALGATGDKSDS